MSGRRLVRISPPSPAAPPVAAMLRVRGRAPAYLLSRHALSPENAVAYRPEGRIDRWWFARLLADGAVRQAASGYWIDLPSYYVAAERLSRRAVLLSVPLSLAVAAAVLLFYAG